MNERCVTINAEIEERAVNRGSVLPRDHVHATIDSQRLFQLLLGQRCATTQQREVLTYTVVCDEVPRLGEAATLSRTQASTDRDVLRVPILIESAELHPAVADG